MKWPSIDILTSCANPEMEQWCRGMVRRQNYDGEINHQMYVTDRKGDKDERWLAFADLVHANDSEYFLMMDDDDYVAPQYLRHCITLIKDTDCYGELPSRTYNLRVRGWGEGRGRDKLFTTFVVFHDRSRKMVVDAMHKASPAHELAPFLKSQVKNLVHTPRLVVMRGMMDKPEQAVTTRKNMDDASVWPNKDLKFETLKEWVDEEAFAELMGFVDRWAEA